MHNLNDVKTLCDDAFLAVGEKGVDVGGMKRSELPSAIRAIELNDYTDINLSLGNILGEPVTDVGTGLAKLAAIKEAERQAIVAKGTLVLQSEKFEEYAQKIRAIHSYSDLTFSGLMPDFILDPEPTGSTIVYMKPVASGTGDGTSWDNAMSDFIAAHTSLSGTKNVIYMEEGVYAATGTITLKANIKIYGGFKASDHSWNARNSFNYRTIFDAQLTQLRFNGNSTANQLIDGLTVINSRVSDAQGVFYNISYAKNLIVQDSVGVSGAAFNAMANCQNLVAMNCSANSGGGAYNLTNCNSIILINCKATATNGGGILTANGCNNLLLLNCTANSSGGGAYGLTNCANVKIINCYTVNGGVATHGDVNCKNFLILNCTATGSGYIVYYAKNIQNYTIANCSCVAALHVQGGPTSSDIHKIYNCICFNNKNGAGTLVGFYLMTANYYYKLYNCRADAAISFAANAATNADIQNFYLIQNNNSETKFANTGTYPIVGNLPYDNNVINQKYIDGNYGDFNIPQNSVLAGAGYWEDGFSFGWDIDGKPRDAAHCSIGAYEPVWA